MSNDEDLIGSAEAAQLLGLERSVFTRKVNGRPPLLRVAMRGSGTTGEKFFRRTDVEALITPAPVSSSSPTEDTGDHSLGGAA